MALLVLLLFAQQSVGSPVISDMFTPKSVPGGFFLECVEEYHPTIDHTMEYQVLWFRFQDIFADWNCIELKPQRGGGWVVSVLKDVALHCIVAAIIKNGHPFR
jgi:hypothetical protein